MTIDLLDGFRRSREQLLPFVVHALRSIRGENDPVIRADVILNVSEALRAFQNEEFDDGAIKGMLSPFFAELLIGEDVQRPRLAAELLGLGLEIARREVNRPSAPTVEFFDATVRRLSELATDARSVQYVPSVTPRVWPLTSFMPTLKAMQQTVQLHGDFITAAYVEMCCEILGTPHVTMPKLKENAHPHERKAYDRLLAHSEETRLSVETAHGLACANLKGVVDSITYGRVRGYPEDLFSDRSFAILDSEVEPKGDRRCKNAFRLPVLLNEIERIVRRPQPGLPPPKVNYVNLNWGGRWAPK